MKSVNAVPPSPAKFVTAARAPSMPCASPKATAATPPPLDNNKRMQKGFDKQSNPFLLPMLMRRFMRVFFHLLYHPFAFTYDLVAAVVSFGQWKNWGRSI